MSDDRISLEHIIRNIAEGKFTPSDEPKVNLSHAIRNVHEAVGTIGTDKYKGSQFMGVRTVTPHISPEQHTQAAETVSNARKIAKQKTSLTLHGKVAEEMSELGGSTAQTASWPATEDGKKKKKLKEESEGTVERRKVKFIARPDDANPKSPKSVLGRTGEIKTKIVDEEKVIKGLTDVIIDPPLLQASPDGDKISGNRPQKDRLKKIVKEAAGSKALGVAGTAASAWDDFSNAYDQFKAGQYKKALNTAGVGVVRGAIGAAYSNPVTGAIAATMEPSPASADDNEFQRQQKYGIKPKSAPQSQPTPQQSKPVAPAPKTSQATPFKPAQNTGSSRYNIQKGDTLSGIAKKTGVSVSQLAKDNNIKDVNKIYSGSNLKINK